jgi:hypothetical protein
LSTLSNATTGLESASTGLIWSWVAHDEEAIKGPNPGGIDGSASSMTVAAMPSVPIIAKTNEIYFD